MAAKKTTAEIYFQFGDGKMPQHIEVEVLHEDTDSKADILNKAVKRVKEAHFIPAFPPK